MTHPPPSYLDPNNVLTAWGSSAAQLGLQVNTPAIIATNPHFTCI